MNPLLQLDVESLPGRFIPDTPLSDGAFEALCVSNDCIQFERTREGEIRMHSPTGLFTSDGNAEINRQLANWWISHRRGRVFDSNAGFFLPDGSSLSPDAAYVTPDKLQGRTKAELSRFGRFCPDFVIELLSESDRLQETQTKMIRWIENGAQLGWLVDPYRQAVTVYGPGEEPITTTGNALEDTGPIEGFTLDLAEVWSRYEV